MDMATAAIGAPTTAAAITAVTIPGIILPAIIPPATILPGIRLANTHPGNIRPVLPATIPPVTGGREIRMFVPRPLDRRHRVAFNLPAAVVAAEQRAPRFVISSGSAGFSVGSRLILRDP